MKAYSTHTETEYESWEDLLESESTGHVVVIVTDRPNTAPFVVGPIANKKEAEKIRVRLRRKYSKEEREYGYRVRTYIRNAWKPELV